MQRQLSPQPSNGRAIWSADAATADLVAITAQIARVDERTSHISRQLDKFIDVAYPATTERLTTLEHQVTKARAYGAVVAVLVSTIISFLPTALKLLGAM